MRRREQSFAEFAIKLRGLINAAMRAALAALAAPLLCRGDR